MTASRKRIKPFGTRIFVISIPSLFVTDGDSAGCGDYRPWDAAIKRAGSGRRRVCGK
jgi:hypothetical protein